MLHRRTFGDKLFDSTNYIVIGLIAATMLFPFYYLLAESFASITQWDLEPIVLWPKPWVTSNYDFVFHSQAFIRSFGASIYVTVLGTVITILATAAMAFGLTKRILGQRTILTFILFNMVFGVALIPGYLIVKYTGLIDTYWSLIIPGLIAPYNLIVFRTFFLELPAELSESAMMDGANELKIFYKIILPLSKPVLAAFSLFAAVGFWNNYFGPLLFLNDPHKWTVQILLRQLLLVDVNLQSLLNDNANTVPKNIPPETVGTAALLLSMLPILCIYPFMQKYFEKGVLLGSIKG